ncbi:unnamed protein product [Trichogramma brassicae]|uniref:C2H2-type domain-containing protein n=1 Tax=Trichogramma brassicae TaxID=86971 RepID=A0A6H5J8J1_9HYME|nr:unnamed protein product [Trichogramma brassicae]
MKQEKGNDNRLNTNIIQVSDQNSIEISMIDNISLITIPAGSEQFTTVPIDASGTIQTEAMQSSHDQSQIEEDRSEMGDMSDDGCDNEAHPDEQLMDVGEAQLMRFTCHACSRSFVAQSHIKLDNDQQQIQQQQPIVHMSPRIQSPINPGSPNQMAYQQPQQQQLQQQPQPPPPQQQQQSSGMPLQNMAVTVQQQQNKNFSCDRCQATFRYRTLLEKHKKMHEMAAGQDKPYSCPRCFMRFETRNLYNHHAKTHKPVITQSEKAAGQSGAGGSKDNNVALLYNKANNTYSCETCAKEFPTVEALTSHKSVHRSRPLICDVCGKGFTHRKYYVVHQRIHTGERPYLCAMCGKSFTQASTLTVHRRYHTGERPYTCTLCGKGFVTRTIMLNHMKKH